MSKGLKILVICSLVLNVLLVGIMIGHFTLRFRNEGFLKKPWHERMSELPPEKQGLFSKTMDQARRANRDIHRQIRDTRRRALDILTAPEFDEAAYRSEMEKLNVLRGKMMISLGDLTTDLAKQLNQEERMALARMLERPMQGPLDDRPGRRHEDRPRRRMP